MHEINKSTVILSVEKSYISPFQTQKNYVLIQNNLPTRRMDDAGRYGSATVTPGYCGVEEYTVYY